MTPNRDGRLSLSARVRRGVDLPSLEAARIEGIKRIWAMVSTEPCCPLRLDRRIDVTDDLGTVVLSITFEEVLSREFMGSC